MTKLATIAALMLLLAGCQTPVKTSDVLDTIDVSVNASISLWGEYVKAGRATSEQIQLADRAIADYRVAMIGARAGLKAYEETGNYQEWQRALAVVVASSGSVMALIFDFVQQSGPPQPPKRLAVTYWQMEGRLYTGDIVRIKDGVTYYYPSGKPFPLSADSVRGQAKQIAKP